MSRMSWRSKWTSATDRAELKTLWEEYWVVAESYRLFSSTSKFNYLICASKSKTENHLNLKLNAEIFFWHLRSGMRLNCWQSHLVFANRITINSFWCNRELDSWLLLRRSTVCIGMSAKFRKRRKLKQHKSNMFPNVFAIPRLAPRKKNEIKNVKQHKTLSCGHFFSGRISSPSNEQRTLSHNAINACNQRYSI